MHDYGDFNFGAKHEGETAAESLERSEAGGLGGMRRIHAIELVRSIPRRRTRCLWPAGCRARVAGEGFCAEHEAIVAAERERLLAEYGPRNEPPATSGGANEGTQRDSALANAARAQRAEHGA